ncbi:DEAD/DEAH box helicase [Acinetobacter apis]|uniref:DUF3427 domain-containing protein n=1 Tax=Acinetobacter apis TaxID=1229165 RepID=UPI000B5893F3|nr:DUF3427 domain-containing protein [Acinetobacter apis]
MLLGSSNLTANALCKNEELNIFIRALPNSKVIHDLIFKKQTLFDHAQELTDDYIAQYSELYQNIKKNSQQLLLQKPSAYQAIQPNLMQQDALASLKKLRQQGHSKALLISATGTGKTYLSAFDVHAFQAKSLLFVVHRENILIDAQKTFRNVFGAHFKSTIFSGSQQDLAGHQYVFATIQSLSKDHHLNQFAPEAFDYIVIDESHRSGSASYLKIIEYFKPKFLLGMTATPDRSDGVDIFKSFDYNIAYEVRLKKAMECDLVCPFHYFGISDLKIDGEPIADHANFNDLVSAERVLKIKQASDQFGTDNGELRALVFCSGVQEAEILSEKMNTLGVRSIALSGQNTTTQRVAAIESISSADNNRVEMIFTVDIFNEGIDIPAINQVIFLRATESSIIYIQQLGRGLRKHVNKEYLTVIDFIGNYEKNFLIPMALFGDNSFNKDQLRKLVTSGSSLLPGASTIYFDEVAKEKIFASINHSNFQTKKDLVSDYKLLNVRLGRMPMMMDFLETQLRDPFSFVSYAKSYYSFVHLIEKHIPILNEFEEALLQFYALEINNTKRVLESLLFKKLLASNLTHLSVKAFQDDVKTQYQIDVSSADITSIVNNLNMVFHPIKYFKDREVFTMLSINDAYFKVSDLFKEVLKKTTFKIFLIDNVDYAVTSYFKDFDRQNFNHGFVYYAKYSRKDVFRILNWEKNQNPQNVGGYLASPDKSNCPIFVTYHKANDISETTKYEDQFIDAQHFQWMSKSKRKISSPDVQVILNSQQQGTLLPLFVKKDDDEGVDFYFIGFLSYIIGTAQETLMQTEEKPVSVVKMDFKIDRPVEAGLYKYLVNA